MTEPSPPITSSSSPGEPALSPRVFISYAHDSVAHREAVRDLWIFLRANGVDACVDLVAAEQRRDWTQWMEKQVIEAEHILVIASPAYKERADPDADSSEGRGVQYEARLIRNLFYGDQRQLQRFLPVVLPGGSIEDLPTFLTPAIATVYKVSAFTKHGAEALLRVLHRLPAEVPPEIGPVPDLPARGHTLSPAPIPLPGMLPRVCSGVPGRNVAFTGREGMLVRLREGLLGPSPSVALHGMGGVGKTQLAAEYVWRFGNNYDAVWWVNAEQSDRIADQLAAFAAALDLVDPTTQVDSAVEALRGYCRSQGGWLVVLDNATSAREVREWLLAGPGHVLVTSRDPHWREIAAPIEVDVFTRNESTALLHAHLPTLPDDHADQLADALGDLPLALAQAAGVLAESGMPITEYLTLLDTTAAEVLDQGEPISYSGSLAKAIRIAVNHLAAADPGAAQLLRLCAFLSPEPIPTRLFTSATPGSLSEPLAAITAEPLVYWRTLALLGRYGLAKVADDRLTVHRLTQRLVRADTPEQDRPNTIALLRTAFPHDPEDPSAWQRCSELLPHIRDAAALATDDDRRQNAASLLTDAGMYLRARADLPTAKAVLEQSLELRSQLSRPDQLEIAETLVQLGIVIRRSGDPVAARAVLERALEIQQREHRKDDHLDIASTLTHLGIALRDLGTFEELEDGRAALDRAVAIREQTLGPDHPDLATALTYLGTILRRLGRYPEARDVLTRALVINKATSGPQHPRTAVTLAHLGHVLRNLGDLSHARSAHEEALAIRSGTYGQEHPEVAFALRDLGRTLRVMGHLDDARLHTERSVQIFTTAYGPEHPDTATSINDLGRVLHSLGDLPTAREHSQHALAIRTARLGRDHPTTATSIHDLASVMRDQGDVDGARTLYAEALVIRHEKLGPDHPDTTGTQRELAALERLLNGNPSARTPPG